MFKKPEQRLEPESHNHDEDVRLQIKAKVHRKLLEVLDLNEAQRIPIEQLHAQCADRVDVLLSEQKYPLSGPEKHRLLREVMDEIFGFGPLDEFMRDPLEGSAKTIRYRWREDR